MREKALFYFVDSLIVGAFCLLQASLAVESTVLYGLIMSCALGARLILELMGRAAWCTLALTVILAAVSVLGFGGIAFPFACMLIVQIAERSMRAHIAFSLVAGVLLALILAPPAIALLCAALCVPSLFFTQMLLARLQRFSELLENRGGENDALRMQLSMQRKSAQSLEHAARLQERNRLAARIHDEIGHGVSGSIILLEGALAILDKEPDRAREAVEAATGNLRSAVDDIRLALRQERSARSAVGLSEIAALLSRFEAEHPAVRTELATEGDLEAVSPLIWVCIQENLVESLTNLLKHSNARHFSVLISQKNRLIQARFRDNGHAGDFRPGMGLSAMEERCAACRGRCVFEGTPEGFLTRMVFTVSSPG